MKRAEDVRAEVSQAYAKAITQGGGCCGPPAGAMSVVTLGYTAGELEGLPEEALGSSFGCGNPVALAELAPGDTVVDLGSGAGMDLLVAAKRVGPAGRVIGVDMTDEMIERARANAARAGFDQVEVRKGLVEDLPVEDATVDWVMSNCVLNLSPEKARAFAEIARVLKPGGRMLVSDIVVRDLPAWARESAQLYSGCVAGAISEAEYLGGLREAGLVDVEVRERHVYTAAEVKAMLLDPALSGGGCCGTATVPIEAFGDRFLQLDGKVASLRIFARRP